MPGLFARLANHDGYLPPTPAHPDALGRFRAVPAAGDPSLTDLGVWNVIGNPDFPKPQTPIWQIICRQETGSTSPLLLLGACSPGAIVAKSIATFKTPGLRDLSHSATSGMARSGQLRNGATELRGIALTPADIAPLRAFLQALNEDYS